MTGLQTVKVGGARGVPFVCLPLWVLDSGVSAQALKLYATLVTLAGSEPGGRHVPREVLAARLGLAHVGRVKRYTDELVAVGALEVSRRSYEGGMRHHNVYRVLETPPAAVSGEGPQHG